MSRQGAEMFVAGVIALFDRDMSTSTATAWASILEQYDDRDLEGAMARVVRRSRFFPTTAEVLEYVDEAREERAERERNARFALPEPAVDINRARAGLKHVRDTLERLGVKPPPERSREKLSTAERRHGIHERVGPLVPDVCRFCRDLEGRAS